MLLQVTRHISCVFQTHSYTCTFHCVLFDPGGLWTGGSLDWWVSGLALEVKNPFANAQNGAGLIRGSRRSPGGGHGNPLWYSCLENPMDKGACWATVHSITKSWTRLKQLITHAQGSGPTIHLKMKNVKPTEGLASPRSQAWMVAEPG